MNKKSSLIWTTPREEMDDIVSNASTLSEILRYFNICNTGNSATTLQHRLTHDEIDYSHITLGQDSNKGKQRGGIKPFPLHEVMIENSTYKRGNLKRQLIETDTIPHDICAICGQDRKWNGEKLVLVLDHINGIPNDHRKENLRFICPNCNSQTITFTGRNVKGKKRSVRFCSKCDKKLSQNNKSGLCMVCNKGVR